VCSLGTLVRRREMFLRKIEQLWTYMSPPKMLKLMGSVSKTETQVSCRVVGS
jgi:DNA polymerase sigma